MNHKTGFYTRLVSRYLFRLHEWLKGHQTYRLLARLEQQQWLTPAELAQVQQQRLQQFVSKVVADNPYYRQLFAELGLTAADIQQSSDLTKLPFLTKAVIKQQREQLKTLGAGALIQYNTGGSSGEPLVFFMGEPRVSHDVAAKLRATRWWGVDMGDTEAVLWGSPIELGKQDRIKQLRDWLFRSHLLPAFNLTAANTSRYLHELQRLKPKMLFGYPSVIHQLAQAAQQQQIQMDQLGIQVVFVTSEMLYPHQRELIEQVFAAPVANGYGARDAGFIAHQCPAGSLHISAEDIIVEIIGPDDQPVQPGQSGEIVITHLQTQDYPFIRYRTGDMGAVGTTACSCGRGLPVLSEVQGRSTDFLYTTAGDKLHALALIYIVRALPAVAKFKIVQHSRQHTELQLVMNSPLSQAQLQDISSGFQARLGQQAQIEIRVLDDISPGKNGKYRYVENLAS